jgi:hypothetical protein
MKLGQNILYDFAKTCEEENAVHAVGLVVLTEDLMHKNGSIRKNKTQNKTPYKHKFVRG